MGSTPLIFFSPLDLWLLYLEASSNAIGKGATWWKGYRHIELLAQDAAERYRSLLGL